MPVDSGKSAQRPYIAWTSAIFFLHTLGLALLFKPIQAMVNNQPLIDQDWGLHFHHLRSLASFWRQDGMSWGYNPYFMAGYPSNTIQDLSIKFFEWVALGLSAIALSPVQWFKISAFLATASIPWLMYFSARNFFATDNNRYRMAVLAVLLGTTYWWNSLPREMFFYGMIGFPVASYLSVLGVSLFYRVAIFPPPLGTIFLGWLLFAAVILPLHVQSILTFLPPMLALLVVRPRILTRRLIAWIIAAIAFSSVANLPWLIPAVAHRGDDVSAEIVKQLPLFANTDLFTFILDYIGPQGYWSFRPSFLEKGFRLALLVLGGFGTWKLIRSDKRELGIMLAGALITLFLVSLFWRFGAVRKAVATAPVQSSFRSFSRCWRSVCGQSLVDSSSGGGAARTHRLGLRIVSVSYQSRANRIDRQAADTIAADSPTTGDCRLDWARDTGRRARSF